MEWTHSSHVCTNVDRLSEINLHKIRFSSITKPPPEKHFTKPQLPVKPATYKTIKNTKALPNDPYIQSIREKMLRELNQFNQQTSINFNTSLKYSNCSKESVGEDV